MCAPASQRIIIVRVVTVMIVIIVISSVARTFLGGNEFSEALPRTNRIPEEKESPGRRGPRAASIIQ